MRIFGIALFLTLVGLPVSLFAQIGSSSSTSSGSNGSTSAATSAATGEGVENLSEAGGFVGGGKPDTFVGTADISKTSSASSRASRTSRTSRTTTTTTRPRTTTTAAMAQRRAGTMGGISSLGSSSQTIRSLTLLDSDMAISPMQRPQLAVNTSLARIQGIQDSRVSFIQSPLGTTAVLRGTVASDRERRVAEQLLLVEPGINRVENLLEIR